MLKIEIRFFLTVILSLLFGLTACNRERRTSIVPEKVSDTIINREIKKVTFFIENSASMFGYVNGSTNYVDVLTELADKPRFADERTHREFNFINGGDSIEITPIGNDPSVLDNQLNRSGFNVGDVKQSNLNEMFRIALDKAVNDSISILISDGLYDLGNSPDPVANIHIAGRETRTKFIERISTGDIQTILIKLNSNFNGKYYLASKPGFEKLKQKRPFYIWIFGDSKLLNEYFPESYISKLSGYQAMARFLKLNKINTPYQPIVSSKPLGRFKFDKKVKNKLVDARPDREGNFRFSIAIDFSSIPTDNDYLQLIDNYSCDGNFKITGIEPSAKKIFEVNDFKPTHLITLSTDKSPIGTLEIKLKNVTPLWIASTNVDDEDEIQGDTSHTYGFKFLTEAIREAYDYNNEEMNITSFTIEITN